MALETGTYISDLVATNPLSSDPKSAGDDHIRLIKSTLKATFPNVTGATTATQADLSAIATKAPLASPALTGTPTAPTAAVGASSTQLATTAFVAATAMSAALPAQTGNAGKFVTTDGANASWGVVTPPSITRSARTSNTILGTADSMALIDITSGTFTQTFTAAATLGSGWYCYIRNSGTGDITLDPNASETIDGLTSYLMYPGEVRLVQCDGFGFNSIVIRSYNKTFNTSGTFVKPPGYSYHDGFIWNAGGSGRKGSGVTDGSGGAGGGCFPFRIPSSQIGATEAVTIGAGGAAQTVADTNGNAGGSSSFGSLIIMTAASTYANGSSIYGQLASPSHAIGFEGTNSPAIKTLYGGTVSTTGGNSGTSIYGGTGGGSANTSGGVTTPGASKFGGTGGVAGGAVSGVDGSAPGGGGGGTSTGTRSGAGADGQLRIMGAI